MFDASRFPILDASKPLLSLFCALFQALECKAGGAAEFGEKRTDVLGSLDGLIDLLGELSLAVRVEDKLFGNGKGSGLHHSVSKSSTPSFCKQLLLILTLPLSLTHTHYWHLCMVSLVLVIARE